MASTPRPHGNGWRTQWLYKGTRNMQRVTVASEEDCWKLKGWVEDNHHAVYEDAIEITSGRYLTESIGSRGLSFGVTADKWIDRRNNATSDSREAYRRILRRIPDVVALPLEQVTAPFVEAYLVKMGEGTTIRHRAYAPNTIRDTGSFIRSVMVDAEELRLYVPGPGETLRRIELPKSQRKRDQRFLTRDEFALLQAASFDGQTRDMIDLMVLTGMRIGEVFALQGDQYEDASDDGGWLDICWHVNRDGNDRVPGTKASPAGRVIDLNEVGASLMRRLKSVHGDGLIFPAAEGGMWHYHHWMRNRWHYTVSRAIALGFVPDKGLPTPHDLRHTFVDWLLDEGEDLYGIQRRLGHSAISVTIDQYGPRKKRKHVRKHSRRALDRISIPLRDA